MLSSQNYCEDKGDNVCKAFTYGNPVTSVNFHYPEPEGLVGSGRDCLGPEKSEEHPEDCGGLDCCSENIHTPSLDVRLGHELVLANGMWAEGTAREF